MAVAPSRRGLGSSGRISWPALYPGWRRLRAPANRRRTGEGGLRYESARRLIWAENGQGMIEMALCLPILILLVTGIMDFGRMYEERIAVTNAARDGVRYATTHPTAWSNAASPSLATIEGQILNSGGPGVIPNNDSHITVAYETSSGTACGYYSATNNAFVAQNSYTQATCVVPGSIILVTVTISYSMMTPGMNRLFPSGVSVTSTAAMVEEQ